MRITPRLVEAAPGNRRVVHLRFEDGLSADVDLSYLLDYGGIFEPLRDPDYFRRFRIDDESATITWPNQADIAPETLYLRAQGHAGAPGSSVPPSG
jgi:Protein of unknown function (DUF2442)